MGEIFEPAYYSVKQKLTLGLSKEVIDKAKAAHINISAITEQVLRAFTYEPAGYTNEDVVKAYAELFKSMQPVLDKYAATVTVGDLQEEEHGYPYDISLQKGELIINDSEGKKLGKISISEALPHLYEPAQILEALMKSLIRAAEKNKNKLATFKFASRFLRMLSEDEEQSQEPSRRTTQGSGKTPILFKRGDDVPIYVVPNPKTAVGSAKFDQDLDYHSVPTGE